VEVKLLTPGGVLYHGEAAMVIARTVDGEIGFLAGHSPLLADLARGALRILKQDGSEETFTVDSGFVEVCDNRVVVLSDGAEPAG
jgi:F-type H+-transporting ATPase subunit epsilon